VRKKIKKISLTILWIIIIGLLIPQNLKMPVDGVTIKDFNHKSYLAYP
jgi:hypothetical protein